MCLDTAIGVVWFLLLSMVSCSIVVPWIVMLRTFTPDNSDQSGIVGSRVTDNYVIHVGVHFERPSGLGVQC